jgi:hypothetical protein
LIVAGAASSRRAAYYCGHWMSNLLSDIKRGKDSFSQKRTLDISSEVIKSVLSLKIDAEFTTVVFKENVWLTNKDNESLNSFQAELIFTRSS